MKRSAVALKNSQCPSILLFWPIKSTAKGTTIKILHFELPENQCHRAAINVEQFNSYSERGKCSFFFKQVDLTFVLKD